MHYGIARLDDGSMKFYCNFSLVRTREVDPNDPRDKKCIRIEADFDNLYYQLAAYQEETKSYLLTTWGAQCFWKHRIGDNVAISRSELD